MVAMQELLAWKMILPKTYQVLRKRLYPDPYGRSTTGTMESVQAIQLENIQNHVKNFYVPDQAILSIAGKIDFNEVQNMVDELFGSWQGTVQQELTEHPLLRGITISNMTRGPNSELASYSRVFPTRTLTSLLPCACSVGVLSDGMSSRLFTEVREKAGLCYTVYAMCHTIKDYGCVLAYAGTTTERAQETLDVMLQEIVGLAKESMTMSSNA